MYYINYIYAKYIKFLYDITKDVQIQSVTKASKKLHLAHSDFLININFFNKSLKFYSKKWLDAIFT